MTIHAENNKKIEAINKSLAGLLNQLKCEKSKLNEVVEFVWGGLPNPVNFNIDSLDKGINILEKLEFKSVDDFNSIKKLHEAELSFLKDPYLKVFAFLEYKSQIDPKFLNYIEIEDQLDELLKKENELFSRGYDSAANAVHKLFYDFNNINFSYFQKNKIKYEEYIIRAFVIIEEAKPILEQHRGYKKILINLAALISTLGIAFIVNKCVNNRYLLFPQTQSSEQLTKLEHRISKLAF